MANVYGNLDDEVAFLTAASTLDASKGYVKEQISKVGYGDTGWRDITTQSNVATSGNIFIRRNGHTVLLVFNGVQLSSREPWQNLVQIPSGFRTDIRIDHRPEVFTDVTTLIMNYEVGQYRSTGHASSDDPLTFRDMWLTSDPWPSTLPGTPA